MGKSAINPAVVGKHSTDIAAMKNDLGIVEDGDTATHTIAQGQYVIWQGALYTADAAIASGTTLAASGGNKNLTAVENGGLNALNGNVTGIETGEITSLLSSGTLINNTIVRSGRTLNIDFFATNTNFSANISVCQLPSGFRPSGTRKLQGYVIINNSRIPMVFSVSANGYVGLSYGSSTVTQVEICGCIGM